MDKKKIKKNIRLTEQALRLTTIRDRTGLTRQRFASRINASLPQYSYWERGEIRIPAWAEANIEREFLRKDEAKTEALDRRPNLDKRRQAILDRIEKLLEIGDDEIENTLRQFAEFLEAKTTQPLSGNREHGRQRRP